MPTFNLLSKLWATFSFVIIILFLKLLGILSNSQIIFGYISYCIYIQISSKTYLYYTKTAKNEKILSMCPELSNPNYKPHFLFPFAFQQMVLSMCNLLIYDKPKLKFRTQKINEYGLTLYWPYFSDFEEISDPNVPILFFMPGMTGDIADTYVLNICIEGLKNGYHVCVYQMRILNENFGVDESKKFDFTQDIDLCLDTIKKIYNNTKIYAISGSFGANNLLFYLGEKNNKYINKKIDAAVSFSNPYNMEICAKLSEGSFISTLVAYLEQKNSHKIKNAIKNCPNLSYIDIQELLKCNSPLLFDEIFSAKIHGYRTATEYYRKISAIKNLTNIDIPVLCINSIDDPITPYQSIAYDDIKLNPNIFLIVTEKGSHMGFISNEKLIELKQWNIIPAFEFLNCQKKLNIKTQ